MKIERKLRHALAWGLSRTAPRRGDLPSPIRSVLVMRIDDRLGNAIMLEPLVSYLEDRLPGASITCLLSPLGARVFSILGLPHRVEVYRRQHVLGTDSIFSTIRSLRREDFDLVIDVSNPADPSTTQAMLSRSLRAKSVIGFAHPSIAGFYSHAVAPPSEGHEIARWGKLTAPLGTKMGASGFQWRPPKLHSQTQVSERQASPLLNIGARLSKKRLGPEEYRRIGALLLEGEDAITLSYGPDEEALAKEVADGLPGAKLAPPTGLDELSLLFQAAPYVVSADTGPMHLAVACGAPTAAIFVNTLPERYGYSASPHCVIDAREGLGPEALAHLREWIEARRSLASESALDR